MTTSDKTGSTFTNYAKWKIRQEKTQACHEWIRATDSYFWDYPAADHWCGKGAICTFWVEPQKIFQDEKNQMVITCLWLNLVSRTLFTYLPWTLKYLWQSIPCNIQEAWKIFSPTCPSDFSIFKLYFKIKLRRGRINCSC